MQAELETSHPGEIELLAVNGALFSSGNVTMAALGDIPLLQDTTTDDVWGSWGVTYRDVVILDEANNIVGVYNLTTHDLNNPTYYGELRDMLTGAIQP